MVILLDTAGDIATTEDSMVEDVTMEDVTAEGVMENVTAVVTTGTIRKVGNWID